MKDSKYKNRSRYSDNKHIVGRDFRSEFYDTIKDAGSIHVARVVDRSRRCRCVALRNDRYNEPDPACKICDTLGFLYSDRDIIAYKAYEGGEQQAGAPKRMRSDGEFFYVEHDVFEDRWQAEFSRIIELKTDSNGVLDPARIIAGSYNIKDAVPYSNFGKRVYWRLKVFRKDV